MNIAVVASVLQKEGLTGEKEFIANLLTTLAGQKKEIRFLIIADKKRILNLPLTINFELAALNFPGKTAIQKKYWWEIKLPNRLKKKKIDVLISFDGQCSKKLNVPQILIESEFLQYKPRNIKKATLVLTNSEWGKERIKEKFRLEDGVLSIITVAVPDLYKPLGESEREKTKANYCDGKEYFLCFELFQDTDSFINLLKSFSHFKKRLQSSLKLILLSKPDKKTLESLSSYKYRNDVHFVDSLNETGLLSLISSSYAVIILQNNIQSIFIALKSLQCAVPLLSLENSPVKEYAEEAALYFEKKSEKEIGEKMIRIYTDEGLRNQLIRNGRQRAMRYTIMKSAELLWSSIQKAVK